MTRRLDELNALEEAEAEKVSGIPITNLEDEERAKVSLLGALAWVHRKRSEPTLKFETYMKGTRTREIANYLFGSDEEDAAAAAEKAAAEAAEAGEGDDAEGGLAVVVDPFPSGVAAVGAEGESGGAVDAEGPVLSRDRMHA
jgi:hypothetical protein